MKVEHLNYYEAEIRVKDRSTLRPDVNLTDGQIVKVHALWIFDEGRYEGQYAMLPSDRNVCDYWMPEEDLVILREITREEYKIA